MEKREKRKRRNFTPEYKAEVVRLVREGKTCGKSIGKIAEELDLTDGSVRAWVRRADAQQGGEPAAPMTEREKQLLKENRMLRMERDILKKATAFFAKEST
jgi:transposase